MLDKFYHSVFLVGICSKKALRSSDKNMGFTGCVDKFMGPKYIVAYPGRKLMVVDYIYLRYGFTRFDSVDTSFLVY